MDTSLGMTPCHCRQEPAPPSKGIKKWLKWTPVITESCYYRNVDTFVLSSTTFHLRFPPTITDTYSHNLKWHYNNSLLQTDLFPVHEATLEIQVCIVTYYFVRLETKPISFLLYPTTMDTKSPLRMSWKTGVDSKTGTILEHNNWLLTK